MPLPPLRNIIQISHASVCYFLGAWQRVGSSGHNAATRALNLAAAVASDVALFGHARWARPRTKAPFKSKSQLLNHQGHPTPIQAIPHMNPPSAVQAGPCYLPALSDRSRPPREVALAGLLWSVAVRAYLALVCPFNDGMPFQSHP